MGYSNESYLNGASTSSDANPDVRVALRLYVHPDNKTSLAMSYDSLNEQIGMSAYHNEGNGLGRWDTSVDIQQNGLDDKATVSAAAGYYGNRAEGHVTQTSVFDGASPDNFNPRDTNQRTSARVGSSIAFADGHVAIGAPIHGGAFAIVYPHESIANKEIVVGNDGDVRAKADGWGPAVVTNIPVYVPSTIPVDAADLPIGYSLGAGTFDIYAPYRAGFALEVGSAYSVSAYGKLLSASGEPLALLTGVAHPADTPEKQLAVFTNADGKFGLEGLAPGSWIIEMATEEGSTTFVINIPTGTEGLFKAGTLRPSGQPW